jgi:hypothetical protein
MRNVKRNSIARAAGADSNEGRASQAPSDQDKVHAPDTGLLLKFFKVLAEWDERDSARAN